MTLRILVLTLLVVALVVAIASVLALQTARSDLDRRVNEMIPAYLDSRDQFQIVSTTNSQLLTALRLGDLGRFGGVAEARDAAETIERRLARHFKDSPNEALFDAQLIAVDAWWDYVDDVMNRRTDGATTVINGLAERFNAVEAANAALTTELKRQLDRDWSASVRRLDRDSVVIVIGTFGAAAIAAFAARRVAFSLSDPVKALAGVASRIKLGDVSARADEHSGPAEVRELAGAFNDLTDERSQTILVRELSLDIAALLRQAESNEAGLTDMCARLGSALRADRCDIFTGRAGEVWQLRYGWRREGLEELPEIDLASRELATELARGPDSPISRRVRVIADATSPDTLGGETGQEFARAFQYRAMISAPIWLEDRMLGLLVLRLDDTARDWTQAEVYAVRQAGELATQAIAEREYVASLQALDRQKNEFLATASHELRTPLTSIAGYLELLQDGDFGELSPAQGHAIDVIRRNTVRLRGLIEDILVLNRIEERGLAASFGPLVVDELVGRVCEELQPIADNASVELDRLPLGQSVLVNGVSDHLERALTNVIGNAIKFTPSGGKVTIRCAADDAPGRPVVRLICTDTGVGIPASDMAMLSTRFFRASNATSMAIPGTGLGLAIVRSIIELHGGTLGIESQEGIGTTVTMTLPRLDDEPQPGTPC